MVEEGAKASQTTCQGLKYLFFNTAHSDSYSSPSEAPMGNAGNVVKFFTFTMAWKRFCYVSEVSGLIHKNDNHMMRLRLPCSVGYSTLP